MKSSVLPLIFVLFSSNFCLSAQESSPSPKEISKEATAAAGEHNAAIQRFRGDDSSGPKPLRPVPDFANFKYLLMSGMTTFNTEDMKQKIVQNLPSDMKLILLVAPGEENRVRMQFRNWMPSASSDRIIIATHRTSFNGFWARDSYPYPVYLDSTLRTGLVAAKYDREFSAHDELAKSVRGVRVMTRKSHVFVGGNLLADESGRCFVVDSPRLFRLSDQTLIESYGCDEVVRLNFLTGIGDVDEVIKILPNKNILTTQSAYKSKLESLGYRVTLLPALSNYRTYANSILIGNLVIMPAFGKTEDNIAKSVYESFGYRVVMVDSSKVSTVGMGSVHCATMAYPEIELEVLMKMIGAEIRQ